MSHGGEFGEEVADTTPDLGGVDGAAPVPETPQMAERLGDMPRDRRPFLVVHAPMVSAWSAGVDV